MKNPACEMRTGPTYLYYILTSIFVFAISCSDNENNPDPEPIPGHLKDSELVYTATAAQIKLLAQFSGLGLDVNEFKFDVDIYKVTYETTFKGSDITASGLVVLPKTTQEVGMLSFQHGTITSESDAPSNFSPSDSEALANALLYGSVSSSGFITAIPDYVGFGASSAVFHPYYVEEFTASAVVDMIRASAELAAEKNIQFNNRLFLAGYSEGGYATMATHKSIEENTLEGFELIASFPAAGAFDIKGMQDYLFVQETYNDPHYIAYVARSYQLTFDFTSVLGDFFKEPYAGRIPSLFDGQNSATEIDAQLTSVIDDLIKEGVSGGIDSNPEYSYLADAFEENSLTDWTPKTRMVMYHGKSDITVPYQNSVDTYNALLSNGASDDVLSFIPLEGTHSGAITPFVMDFVPKLWALR